MIDQLQKTFKDSYTKQLIDGVKSGRRLCEYRTGKFEIDESQIRHISGVYQPIGLQQRLIAAAEKDKKKHGAEVAIELYKSYKNLSPLVASNESFWAYLCHTELKEFARLEWPWERARNEKNYVLSHYFFGRDFNRNALASLWWGVYLSFDEERKSNGKDPYALTHVFFKNYSLRTT